MKYRNNPLNIRYNSANNWQGQLRPKNGFCQFSDLYHGFRAGVRLIIRYRSFGVKTIERIIGRFAPPSENKTEQYIDYVCKRMPAISRDCLGAYCVEYFFRNYEIKDSDDIAALLCAMANIEIGEYSPKWYDLIKDICRNENIV